MRELTNQDTTRVSGAAVFAAGGIIGNNSGSGSGVSVGIGQGANVVSNGTPVLPNANSIVHGATVSVGAPLPLNVWAGWGNFFSRFF